MRLIALISLLTACAGCSGIHAGYVARESNYVTYEHPFTEAAAESVRERAGKRCAETKLQAVKTRSACTMTMCTTDYQCMTSEEAASVATPDLKKR